MKSLIPALLLMGLLTGILSSCGQKGDLYLPENPPPADSQDEDEDGDD